MCVFDQIIVTLLLRGKMILKGQKKKWSFIMIYLYWNVLFVLYYFILL